MTRPKVPFTLPEPSATAYFVVGVVGPAVVATVGALAALRRHPGRWRTLLLVGLVVAGVLPALSWWAPWVADTGVLTSTTGGWFGYDEAGVDTFARALWLDLLTNVAHLVAFAAVVAAAVLGRERRSGAATLPT
jgi:pimeloyl-ACP methyl ester carboxylesterase